MSIMIILPILTQMQKNHRASASEWLQYRSVTSRWQFGSRQERKVKKLKMRDKKKRSTLSHSCIIHLR